MDTQALLAELEQLRERVRELEAQSVSSNCLGQLVAGAPIGFIAVDANLQCLFINEALASLHGRAPEDCAGRALREIAGANAEHLEPVCRRVLETGETVGLDLTLSMPGASIGRYSAVCYGLRDSEGSVTGVCGAICDVTTEHKAESRLLESEQRYRDLAESLSEFVWTEYAEEKDAEGTVDYSSPHALRYAGVSEGFDWKRALHPEDAGRLARALAGQERELQIELRILRAADGEYRWHLARIARLGAGPRGRRLLGTAIDIHDRKRREQTRALLASIIESSSDCVVGLDLAGRITSWNPAAEELFGYRAAEVLGRPVSILRTSQTEERMRESLARVAAGATIESIETIRATADGRERQVFVSFAPIRDEAGHVTGAFKTIRDVTEQRRVERELRAAHERFRVAQRALCAGIWERDLDSEVMHWSPEFYELAGIDASEPPSIETWMRCVHPDDAERARNNVERALERREDLRHQFRIIRNGETRWITAFGQVVIDPGRGPRLIGISIDTTDLHTAEEAVRQAARFESIARLAGGVAHDFNNLLAGIMGGASFIAEVLPDDHSARTMLDLILRSSERAAQLTRQLLAYAGQGAFTLRRFDLSRAVQEACSLARASMPARIELELQTGWNLPQIEADPNQIREVVLGLVSNASEAIGEGLGSIHVRTGIERVDRAAIASRFSSADLAPGSYVYLEVQDNGPGMAPDVLNRIFEPFFTTKFMGRGLGLSAVQGIVRGHRGAIEVETRPGAGARFRVYFPSVAPEAGREKDRPSEKRSRAVLVVDDEEAVRDVVQMALSRAGYTVITASDGVAGLEAFRSREWQISLVILDVSMPKMSGAEVLARIRESGATAKVLITSGYPESEAMAQIPIDDIAGFLQKPFTVRQLAAMIAKVMGSTAAAGSD